jgi:putative DeoR family transcriptional regulator (stage III sporulation protein D)
LGNDIVKRVIDEAEYMVETEKTLREIAKVFKVSKSTVHKDLKDRLKIIDKTLYEKTQKILKYHMDIRHIKGGESTKKKYLNLAN